MRFNVTSMRQEKVEASSEVAAATPLGSEHASKPEVTPGQICGNFEKPQSARENCQRCQVNVFVRSLTLKNDPFQFGHHSPSRLKTIIWDTMPIG